MNKTTIFSGLALVLVLIAGGVGGLFMFSPSKEPETRNITLAFSPTDGQEPFVFDAFNYDNPGGDGKFQLRDFRFYISNLVLSDGETEFKVPDSYHLVPFNGRSELFELTLLDVPLEQVKTLGFSIGVDEDANVSLQPHGDLDLNSRMAWNWEIGHKFLLAEGSLRIADSSRSIVYHVGFNESRRDVAYDAPAPVEVTDATKIPIEVDILSFFDSEHTTNMLAMPAVKMHKGDAQLLADNYANMISVSWPG